MAEVEPRASPPSITSLSPTLGPVAGGASVSIVGKNFTGTTAVKFGTVAATSFALISDTAITAVSPAQAVGVVNVTVTTPNGGTSAGVPYTYEAPLAAFTTATIKAGQSLSETIDLTNKSLWMIIVPPNWTSAYLSFQLSNDCVIWGDLYENTSELIRVVAPASAVLLSTKLTQHALYMKLRSGTRDKPVAQKQDSVFQLSLASLAA